MRKKYTQKWALLLLIAVAGIGSCGDDDPVSPGSVGGGIYVSSEFGHDDATGRSGDPLKTITRALEVSGPNVRTIRVRPGLYSSETGERFPIVLARADLVTEGEEDVTIRGAGMFEANGTTDSVLVSIAIPDSSSARVVSLPVDLIIDGGASATGLWIDGTSSLVVGVDASGGGWGIVVAGVAAPEIERCVLGNNTGSGLLVANAAGPVVRRCTIEGNRVGVAVLENASPDLGTLRDAGENTIRGNGDADLCHTGDNDILAQGNIWDANAFTFTAAQACTGGANVADSGLGTTHFQDLPASGQLFPGAANSIRLVSPDSSAVLGSVTPGFVWEDPPSSLQLVALFSRPPRQVGNRINNPEDMIWAWHPGLGRGSGGDVSYEDGAPVIDGYPIDAVPLPLESGRTYYWAVWAWDASAEHVAYSSDVWYFIVAN